MCVLCYVLVLCVCYVTCVHVCVCVSVCVFVVLCCVGCMCACLHACRCMCVHVCRLVCVCALLGMPHCMYVCVWMFVGMGLLMCVRDKKNMCILYYIIMSTGYSQHWTLQLHLQRKWTQLKICGCKYHHCKLYNLTGGDIFLCQQFWSHILLSLNTIQLYCQVSIQLHEECFVVPSSLITHSHQSQNTFKIQQQQTNIQVKSHS